MDSLGETRYHPLSLAMQRFNFAQYCAYEYLLTYNYKYLIIQPR